jgi:hypothetical protein
MKYHTLIKASSLPVQCSDGLDWHPPPFVAGSPRPAISPRQFVPSQLVVEDTGDARPVDASGLTTPSGFGGASILKRELQ